MNVLVVAAHPDDEVLGCGGTIAGISREHPVHVVILGEGATSRTSQRSDTDPALVIDLKESAKSAAALLGVKTIQFKDLPDNRFDELSLLDVVKQVEHSIDELRPDTVYTHHPGDLNIDHQITFRAVLTATRPTEGCPVRDLYAFEVPSSSEWAFQQLGPPFKPNVFNDITSTIDLKIQGLQCYTSEMRDFPHPRSSEAVRAIARRWGTVVGMEFAEAFELIRSVRS